MDAVIEKRQTRGGSRRRIDSRDFIVAYMTCNSIDDIMKTMGLSRGSVTSKAMTLRKMGVKLPKRFGPGSKVGRELEIAQLNSLVNKYQKDRR